ncbi:hypothetical protein GOBAR_DD02848 [Gossypium barbadense]|nr:hypothetical protein GOBAR_DD02848 [Gossypium barbadense]
MVALVALAVRDECRQIVNEGKENVKFRGCERGTTVLTRGGGDRGRGGQIKLEGCNGVDEFGVVWLERARERG